METDDVMETEIEQLRKQLKKAERKIKRLQAENVVLASMNKKALSMREFKERELVLEKERAEKADRAKSDFLASMSHEIRTPINAVLGMNELVLRETQEENVREYAADIENSGKLLLSLINDILDFSKIESGKMKIMPVEYEIASVVRDIMNMMGGRAKEKGLSFSVELEEDIPEKLFGDEIRIRQIIMNLMSNAIKYTEKGSVKLSVKSEKIDDELNLFFIVSDTGKGIRKEDQIRLFESFTRGDEEKNRTIEGTGLGLTLTRRFVEMMGGGLTLESEYGKGSTFTAYIRQGIVSATPVGDFRDKIENSKEQHLRDENGLIAPDCKILVVDDVKMNCKVFCGLLKHTKIQIDSALSGAEALEKCKEKAYDLIYMDHSMPQMDGIECLHALRKMDSVNKNTPVIVLTANAIAGMREMYLAEGFVDYLTKPIDVKYLEGSICRYGNI